MKEEALKIDLIKVFVTYSMLGLILGVGLLLNLLQTVPGSLNWDPLLYFITPINGVLGVLRERGQKALKFSKKGLRVSKDKIISWEDLELTMQFSSKLFGKSYIIGSKTAKLQDHMGINWWNEEELVRLIQIYTPERHALRKLIDEHEFGLSSQLSLSTKIFVNKFWSTVSFDYVFLVIICCGVMSVKYF